MKEISFMILDLVCVAVSNGPGVMWDFIGHVILILNSNANNNITIVSGLFLSEISSKLRKLGKFKPQRTIFEMYKINIRQTNIRHHNIFKQVRDKNKQTQ